MAVILDQQDIDVFIGLDVGKSGHHAVALDRAGKKLFDKALPNDEARLREFLDSLSGHGKILLVVDQPATIGALPVAVAQAAGAAVGYLPGLAMRRIADLHPDQAKTDARDAAIIAEAARSMPIHCGRLPWTRPWPNSAGSAASTTTSPARSPLSRTGSAGCSPRSTRPLSGHSARISITLRWRTCSRAIRHRPH